MQMDEMAYGLRDVLGRSTRHLQMISENLANASTPGYRAGEVMTEPVLPFNRMLNNQIAAQTERDATDLSPGSLRKTERPLDFALSGEGFFVVANGENQYLTRNGSFEIDNDRYLRSAAGHFVLDADGEPLRIPPNVRLDDVHAGEDGRVYADGRAIGRFRLERVEHESDLQRVGTTLFTADPARRSPAEMTRVLGRTLESSNTVVFQELSNLMLLNRTVEAMQRAQGNEMQAQRKMMDALAG
jgi:flagellar basal-body rod protein FlgF